MSTHEHSQPDAKLDHPADSLTIWCDTDLIDPERFINLRRFSDERIDRECRRLRSRLQALEAEQRRRHLLALLRRRSDAGGTS